jgi:trigger factor
MIKINNTLNVQIETLGAQHEKVTIQVAAADYRDAYSKSLKDLAKKAQFKGFRPGHVPMGMVKKLYGDQALAEELNKIVNQSIENHLKESAQQLLGEAVPSTEERVEIDYNQEKDYTFVYEIGLQPTFELGLSSADTFIWEKIPAKEDEINEEVARLQKKYGKRDDVDVAEEGDVVYVQLTELNAEGNAKENGLDVQSFFNHEMLTDQGKTFFAGMDKTFSNNIPDVFSVFKGDRGQIAGNVLQMKEASEEAIADINSSFSCAVQRIVRLFPAELDAEFFSAVSAEYGEIADADALSAMIRSMIEQHNDNMTRVQVDNEMYKALIERTQMTLPEQFLEKWYASTQQEDESQEQDSFPEFLRKLKESLIFRKVQQAHQLEVGNDEIIQAAVQQVRSTYGQLGEDFVRYIVESQLKERTFVESMHDRVMQTKFLDIIRSMVTLEDKATTLEEYQSKQKELTNAE